MGKTTKTNLMVYFAEVGGRSLPFSDEVGTVPITLGSYGYVKPYQFFKLPRKDEKIDVSFDGRNYPTVVYGVEHTDVGIFVKVLLKKFPCKTLAKMKALMERNGFKLWKSIIPTKKEQQSEYDSRVYNFLASI